MVCLCAAAAFDLIKAPQSFSEKSTFGSELKNFSVFVAAPLNVKCDSGEAASAA